MVTRECEANAPSHSHIDTDRKTQRGRARDRDRDRQTDRDCRHRFKLSRQTGREADKQTDRQTEVVSYVVLWAQSATKDYVKAENTVESVSSLLTPRVIIPQVKRHRDRHRVNDKKRQRRK